MCLRLTCPQTGCANADASEVVLQGHVAATGVTAGTGIVDFDVPGTHVEPAFNGTLVLKPKGTVGYGSPYPPDRVEVTVLPSASGDGDYGIAAYVPAKAGTGGSSEKIANIAWFHDKNNAINPASQITADSIARNVEIKAYTNKNPSYLRVYYVSIWSFERMCWLTRRFIY